MKLIDWLLTGLVLCACGMPAVAEDNILANPGCEDGENAPTHWSQGAKVEGVAYVWDRETGHKSKSSLCLHKTARRYFPIAQWYQIVERTGSATALEIKTQVKAEQATKAVVDVIFLDEDDKWISHKWASYVGSKKAVDPEWLKLNWDRTKHIMLSPHGLDRKTRELIALAVSEVNHCEYCALAHETMARMNGATEQEVNQTRQIIELFCSFNAIADTLRVPCDVSPEMLKEKQ